MLPRLTVACSRRPLHKDVSAPIIIPEPELNDEHFGMLIDVKLGTQVQEGKIFGLLFKFAQRLKSI